MAGCCDSSRTLRTRSGDLDFADTSRVVEQDSPPNCIRSPMPTCLERWGLMTARLLDDSGGCGGNCALTFLGRFNT